MIFFFANRRANESKLINLRLNVIRSGRKRFISKSIILKKNLIYQIVIYGSLSVKINIVI